MPGDTTQKAGQPAPFAELAAMTALQTNDWSGQVAKNLGVFDPSRAVGSGSVIGDVKVAGGEGAAYKQSDGPVGVTILAAGPAGTISQPNGLDLGSANRPGRLRVGDGTAGLTALGSKGSYASVDAAPSFSLWVKGKLRAFFGQSGIFGDQLHIGVEPSPCLAFLNDKGQASTALTGGFVVSPHVSGASVFVGTLTQPGALSISRGDGVGGASIYLDGKANSIRMANGKGIQTLTLDAEAGDIVMGNADIAEEFDMETPGTPGAVMVLCPSGRIRPCDAEYDTRVVGVLSGAGAFRPALLLDRREQAGDGEPGRDRWR